MTALCWESNRGGGRQAAPADAAGADDSGGLATFGPIEHHPNHHLVAELFEPMWQARRRKQDIIWAEPISPIAVHKETHPLRHHVQLVLQVRLLRIRPARCVQLDTERPVFEDRRRPLAA